MQKAIKDARLDIDIDKLHKDASSSKITSEMLREIDKINVKPFYTKKQDVYYVDENGAVGLSSNVKRKRSRVLSQGISSSDNRRIVWYVDENVFYAAYFFAQHDKTPQYN